MACALYYYAGKLRPRDYLALKIKTEEFCFNLNGVKIPAYIFPLRLPDKPLKALKKLDGALYKGEALGCRYFALPPSLCRLRGNKREGLINGSLFSLALLPLLLDKGNLNWRYLPIIIPLNGSFMAAAARVIASEARFLHLYAPPGKNREELAAQIFKESGLICTLGKNYPPGGLFILPPNCPGLKNSPYTWQSWPRRALLPKGEYIPFYWGEALLWDSLNYKSQARVGGDFFEILSYMRRLAQSRGILPA